jgi:hypothetical protein
LRVTLLALSGVFEPHFPALPAATSPFPPIPHKVPLLETKSQVFKPADLWVLSLCLPACFTTPLDRSVTNRTRADEQVDKSAVRAHYALFYWIFPCCHWK